MNRLNIYSYAGHLQRRSFGDIHKACENADVQNNNNDNQLVRIIIINMIRVNVSELTLTNSVLNLDLD